MSAFEALLAAANSRRMPPVAQWRPSRVGAIDIRIAASGVWFHEGAPIKRPAIVKLFATVLRLDDGVYYLVTPAEKLRITVEDAPFLAVGMECDGAGAARRVLFNTNVGDAVVASATHPITVEERGGRLRPYIEVRRGLRALITRPMFYHLAELADEGPDGDISVWSGGARFVLGSVGEPH